jgi:hypothetical protein
MGSAGRAFVEAELSLARMADAHDRLYQRLAGVKAGPRPCSEPLEPHRPDINFSAQSQLLRALR